MSVDNALVSVIIPTYNRASLIRGAIESALAQTYPHKQIIVVDDGSIDDTAAIVRSYKDVQYIYQPNGGQAAARNTGLRHARGSYITSLDSDDVWDSRFLETCVELLEKLELDFVFANWDQERENGRVVDYFSEFPFIQPYLVNQPDMIRIFSYAELRSLFIECCPAPSSSFLIRHASLVSAWNEKMHIGDDWCLLLDIILSKECKAALIRERLWLKKINCNNIYDSRDFLEATRLLYVEDGYEMLHRYAGRLTKEERRQFQARYNEYMIKTIKRDLRNRSDLRRIIRFLGHSILQNPVLLIKMLGEGLVRYTKRKQKERDELRRIIR